MLGCSVSNPRYKRHWHSVHPNQHLFGLSQTHSVVAQVIHAVPLAEESVSQNREGSDGFREVHTHERADARALNLEDVVVGGDGEVVAGQGQGQVRQRVALVAFDGVLTVPGLRCTNFLVPTLRRLALDFSLHPNWTAFTYKSSAMVEGKAMREVPVSRMTPVFSSSATLSPKATASKSTSQ